MHAAIPHWKTHYFLKWVISCDESCSDTKLLNQWFRDSA
jgi:hypothetical protein